MPNLLSPISFAGLTLRNRIVMPPMWSGRADAEGAVTDAIIDYHRVRAAAGCGLVIVEHAFVEPCGRASSTQLGVHRDELVPGLARLAKAIRSEGAVACQQVSHAGSRTSTAVTGYRPVAPSAVRHPYQQDGEVPESLDTAGIARVIAAFAAAAKRVRDAGFDAVEIHAAHGFLLSQFLSPLTNRREDLYGGTEEGRRRLHLEVLAAVREAVGEMFPIFVRLGAHDETEGGLELDEACRTASALARAGVCLIDVSGGLQGSRGAGKPPGYFVDYAASIRAAAGIPVTVAGGITEPSHADEIVREGRADMVGVGRAMLDDPEWARKAIAALGPASR
ncbi:MAG: tRNA-dihydrouridine synthase [Vicinamibacterales bacterium]